MGIYDDLAKCFKMKDAGIKLPSDVRKKGNAIIAKYTRNRIEPKELQNMYKELESIGISVGVITGDASKGMKKTEVYYKGEEVDNSMFVYSVYKPQEGSKYEYTIYLS